MSQFWHSHWTEDTYKPGLLGNWQVPSWHPKWPCVRHCVTTSFLADRTGRLLPDKPKSKRSPWGDFKGTWELPLKIDRKLAQKLSAPPKYKLAAWEAHKIRYEGPCGISPASPKATKEKPVPRAKSGKSPVKSVETTQKPVARSKRTVDRKKVTIAEAKGKKAKEAIVQTKGTSATRREIDKTDRAPERNHLKTVVVKDTSEAPEDEDEKTVAEEPDYQEEKTVTKEPEYEDESTVTEEPEYEDDKVVSEVVPVEKTGQKQHRKVERTESLCPNNFDSHSLAKVSTKATRNVCTVHRRLRV